MSLFSDLTLTAPGPATDRTSHNSCFRNKAGLQTDKRQHNSFCFEAEASKLRASGRWGAGAHHF
jgi:hypothetical protein